MASSGALAARARCGGIRRASALAGPVRACRRGLVPVLARAAGLARVRAHLLRGGDVVARSLRLRSVIAASRSVASKESKVLASARPACALLRSAWRPSAGRGCHHVARGRRRRAGAARRSATASPCAPVAGPRSSQLARHSRRSSRELLRALVAVLERSWPAPWPRSGRASPAASGLCVLGRRRREVHGRVHDAVDVVAVERRHAGEHLVEHHAQREDVATR